MLKTAKNNLPTSETDFLCVKCKAWHSVEEAEAQAQPISNTGVSVILDVSRAVSGHRESDRARFVCRSCCAKRWKRTKVYLVILGVAVVGLIAAFLMYWFRS